MLNRRTKFLPVEPVKYPSGTFLHTEKGYFYVVSASKRFRVISKRVLESWSPPRVVETTEAAAANHRIAAKLKFRNGSLLYSQANGKMFLVSDNQLRHITNPDWLDWLNLDRRKAVWVSQEEINLHELGDPLD